MARKPRVHFPGAFYHVIARGNKDAKVFKTAQDYKLYLRFLKEYKKRYPFLLYAYVLMPTHVHLLIEVQETPLSKIMQSLQFRYTRHYNLKYRTWGHLFQGRYKAILCEKDPYFMELSAYIHLNPVRAGLEEDPLDYPWSSYKAYASGAVEHLLDQRVLLAQFSKNPFRARKEFVRFVKSRMGQGKREEFYKAKDQRFLGSEDFVGEVQERLGERGVFRYQLSIPEIVAGVVSDLGISKESIYSENRNREGSFARGIVGYLARRLAGYSLKSVAEHFGRDPVAISQGVGKLESRLREDENLERRITELAEKSAKGRKRILIYLSLTPYTLSFTIADISLSIHSTDPSLKLQFQGATKNFYTQGGNPDITVEVGWDDLSRIETSGNKIFDSGGTWRLYENNGNYKFYFFSEAMGPVPYKTAEVPKNFSRARVFIHNPYFDPSQPIYPLEYPLDELLFVHFLSLGRGAEVHACGISDSQGKGYLFIGQSGTGKSTMARLWKDQPGITILSDDRIVLRKMNGGFWMYGTPWHGEGRFFSVSRAQLSRIYFLGKGEKNELIPYRPAEAIGHLTACSFLPFYKTEALDFTMAFFEEMVKTVPTRELRFVPDRRVVDLIEGVSYEV